MDTSFRRRATSVGANILRVTLSRSTAGCADAHHMGKEKAVARKGASGCWSTVVCETLKGLRFVSMRSAQQQLSLSLSLFLFGDMLARATSSQMRLGYVPGGIAHGPYLNLRPARCGKYRCHVTLQRTCAHSSEQSNSAAFYQMNHHDNNQPHVSKRLFNTLLTLVIYYTVPSDTKKYAHI
jgi:hypothetical protein